MLIYWLHNSPMPSKAEHPNPDFLPPGHIGLHDLQHIHWDPAGFNKGTTEDFAQPQHVNGLPHPRADTFDPANTSTYKLHLENLHLIQGLMEQNPVPSDRRVKEEGAYSRMRTANTRLFLAGGRGGGGLWLALASRTSSLRFFLLYLWNSSRRLKFSCPFLVCLEIIHHTCSLLSCVFIE